MRSDHCHMTAYQIGCEVGQFIVLSCAQRYSIATFCPRRSQFHEHLAGMRSNRMHGRQATCVEDPDHRHRLLRARREGPRRRAAEQSNKIPSPHGSSPAKI